jgi:hypothetical protein
MAWRKTLLCSVFVVVFLSSFLIVPSARAQHEIEITPFAGYKFGGQIDIPTGTSSAVDYLPIKSSYDYGLDAAYSIWPNFQAEFMWDHQPTNINEHFPANDSQTFLTSSDIDMFQFDVVYNLKPPDARLKPFIAAGLGFTHWRPSSALPVPSNTFSYNIGGGVKYFFSPHVGLRLDVRWLPSRTTQQLGEACDFYGFCGPTPVSAHAEQGAVNGGIIFRFR